MITALNFTVSFSRGVPRTRHARRRRRIFTIRHQVDVVRCLPAPLEKRRTPTARGTRVPRRRYEALLTFADAPTVARVRATCISTADDLCAG